MVYKALFFIIILPIMAKGQEMSKATFSVHALSSSFRQKMIEKKTWSKRCPVSLDRLRVITFSYYDFEGKEHHNGDLVVLDAVARRVVSIFKRLHELKFPIAKARSIEHYDGSDEASMADNNTSCFNCREITGGGGVSLHSYGLAIDVNPVQNPAIFVEPSRNPLRGAITLMPPGGKEYLNRTNLRPGMAESIVDIFKENGFRIWGGGWQSPIDWQHFQVPRALAKLLAALSSDDAEVLFETYVQNPNVLNFDSPNDDSLIARYRENPKGFMASLKR